MISTPEWVVQRLRDASRYWLFLDYDGTLADFAPTPDDIHVDRELIQLLTDLASLPQVRIAVISGRRLGHITQLLPVPGITLAGTYGVEIQTADGAHIDRLDAKTIRPRLISIHSRWQAILNQKPGFYLEDKFWSLAIHAKNADDDEAEKTIRAAKNACQEILMGTHTFQILGGHKFLEVAPLIANKGKTIKYILQEIPFPGAEFICIGDDDKDEQAFEVIKCHGGIAIQVSEQQRPTNADFRLQNPAQTRTWLAELGEFV